MHTNIFPHTNFDADYARLAPHVIYHLTAYCTAQQIADWLGVSRSTIQRLKKSRRTLKLNLSDQARAMDLARTLAFPIRRNRE